MTINTFSELLMVFAQTLLLFSSDQSTDDTHSLLFFSFLLQGPLTNDLDAELERLREKE
jgi:hypothetical protein